MKPRILATLLVAGAFMAPMPAAHAGPLRDALSNKLGQAVFVGKVAKAKLKDAIGRRVKDVLFP
jgi:integral membrane sensor domain MASE1